ncbi:hypothetical protein D3C80_385950 [compost metagenome]
MDKRMRAQGIQLVSPKFHVFRLQNGREVRLRTEVKDMLLTRELTNQLRRNADISEAEQRDHKPVVKFFTPDANATWLFSELASDDDTLFGLCDLGLGYPELGYASLAEISILRGRLGLLVERDKHFKADKLLSAYADAARTRGRIVA